MSSSSSTGKLKLFFGMSPGVGKTYAMLQAGRVKLAEGVDVVAGVVETHERAETEALLEGIPVVPRQTLSYRDAELEEMDLDAILKRKPDLVLVDELAHSNVPGSRHDKRYLDVRELLDNGIHVYSTLNVQHLESRADGVERLTGVTVRERVPDTLLDWADEIEIIDLSPEGLRRRLAEGKVYQGGVAATAAEGFFSARNLTALREMALRSTAQRVNQGLVNLLKQERTPPALPTGERILVAVGPSPFSESLIRWTRGYADSLNASWVAVHIEKPEPSDPETTARLNANLELARSLGADIVSTAGEEVAAILLRVARRELVTQIVVGRSPRRRFWGRSLSEQLIDASGEIAVHLVPTRETKKRRAPLALSRRHELVEAVLVPILATLVFLPLREPAGYWTISLLYLTLTLAASLRLGRGPMILFASLSAVCWNFFFVEPRFTFWIATAQDVLLFLLLFLIAMSMGQLTARLRLLRLAERRREHRADALFRFLNDFTTAADLPGAIEHALRHTREVSGGDTALWLPKSPGARTQFPENAVFSQKETGVMDWVMQNRTPAGMGTRTLPEMDALYLPVDHDREVFGVLRVHSADVGLATRDLLLQMMTMLAQALERESLQRSIRAAEIDASSRRLQKVLLDTVSHELKTPLTVLLGSVEALAEPDEPRDLAVEAARAGRRLLRNVDMLLDLSRYESGTVKTKSEWIDPGDLVEQLRNELRHEFAERVEEIQFEMPGELFRSDEVLVFQLFKQLLRNALGHTPPGGRVRCRLRLENGEMLGEVSDSGPGLPPGENVEALFQPFRRGGNAKSKGLGLGLSITRRICQALGGEIHASAQPQGGLAFTTRFPLGVNDE